MTFFPDGLLNLRSRVAGSCCVMVVCFFQGHVNLDRYWPIVGKRATPACNALPDYEQKSSAFRWHRHDGWPSVELIVALLWGYNVIRALGSVAPIETVTDHVPD
jgi:hypothetical protein